MDIREIRNRIDAVDAEMAQLPAAGHGDQQEMAAHYPQPGSPERSVILCCNTVDIFRYQ